MANSDWIVQLEAVIDNSSLTNAQKKIAKEHFKADLDIQLDIDKFASQKKQISKSVNELATEMKTAFSKINIDLSDKQANSFAREFLGNIRQSAKEQEKLNNLQKKNNLATQEKYYKRIIDNNKTIYFLKEKLLRADEKQSQEIQNQITKLEKRNQYNYGQLNKKGLTDNSWEREVNTSKEVLENRFRINQEKQKDIALSKQISDIDRIQSSTDITDLETKYKRFGIVSEEVETSLRELKSAHDAVINTKGTDRLATEIEKYDTALDKAKTSLHELTNTQVSMNQRTSQMTTMQEWMRKNQKATKLCGDQVQKLIQECQTCDKVRFDQIKNEFKELQVEAGKAGKLGNTLWGSIVEEGKKFIQWSGVTGIVMSVWYSLKSGVSTVKDLDTALVDLKKTTDATASQLEEFYYSSNNTAKRLGVATEEIINATSAWSRLGYAIKDASTMAENSAILASISPEMNIDTATDGLVSTLKAFKIEAEDSLDGVISKINIIGNTQAVDNNDVVDILTRSSSAMAEANNTLEETIALGVAATEITRDAEAVGTMLKTVSMRIRGYDEELESYTDDLANLSGTIADLTKTASSPQGISLFTDDTRTTYKSTYQILKDISEIYDELDDKTQAKLLEALAGKRQGQAVAAIINNFENAEKSMNSMANSAGNAMKEMEVIYDSLDYKLNKLGETGTGIAQNLFNREDMKTVVDGLTWVGEKIDWLTDKLGLFGTIGLLGGAGLSIKNVGGLKMQSLICFE